MPVFKGQVEKEPAEQTDRDQWEKKEKNLKCEMSQKLKEETFLKWKGQSGEGGDAEIK